MKRKIDFNNRATDQVAFHNMMNEKDEEKISFPFFSFW